MRALLSEIVELFPSPAEAVLPEGVPTGGAAGGPRLQDRLRAARRRRVLFRLYCGTVKNGEEVWNAEHNVAEKLNHLSVQQGKERIEVPELHAGDIGSVAKLRDTHTGDTFCRRENPVRLPADPLPRGDGDVGGDGEAAGRRGQAGRRPPQAARGGSHLPLRVQLGAGADAGPRDGRASLRDPAGPAGAELRRARRTRAAQGGLSRDAQG